MRLALLGDPVAHSLSPLIHQAALDDRRIAGSYVVRRVDDRGLERALDDLRSGVLDGANVTMPHKRLAWQLVDDRSAGAGRAGAVNCLVRVGKRVVGHNTDIAGVREAWGWSGLPEHGPVLVLGAGGGAAAALLALEGRHELSLAARRQDRAELLLEGLQIRAVVVPWGDWPSDRVLVNATPIGMEGESLPAALVDRCSGLFEMVYASGPSPAQLQVTTDGKPVASGTEMLLAQAAASFRLWVGGDPPLGPMRAALEAATSPSSDAD